MSASTARTMSTGNTARLRRRLNTWALFILMVAVAVVMLYPFWYMIDNAFRSPGQFDQQSGHSLTGWRQLFANLPVADQLLNSTLVCVAAIALILVISTTAGFAFAKLRYRGSGPVFLLVVSALVAFVFVKRADFFQTEADS